MKAENKFKDGYKAGYLQALRDTEDQIMDSIKENSFRTELEVVCIIKRLNETI